MVISSFSLSSLSLTLFVSLTLLVDDCRDKFRRGEVVAAEQRSGGGVVVVVPVEEFDFEGDWRWWHGVV